MSDIITLTDDIIFESKLGATKLAKLFNPRLSFTYENFRKSCLIEVDHIFETQTEFHDYIKNNLNVFGYQPEENILDLSLDLYNDAYEDTITELMNLGMLDILCKYRGETLDYQNIVDAQTEIKYFLETVKWYNMHTNSLVERITHYIALKVTKEDIIKIPRLFSEIDGEK